MITSTITGKKITANQLAKEAVADRLDLVEYYLERYPEVRARMTEKELNDFHGACVKKVESLLKYLKVDYMGQPIKK